MNIDTTGGGGNFDVSTGYATLTVSKADQTIALRDGRVV
jgi:hypothetical protein